MKIMKRILAPFLLGTSIIAQAQTTFSYGTQANGSVPVFNSGISMDSLRKLMGSQTTATIPPRLIVNPDATLKPGATDYQVLAISGAIAEFHDHEVRTANGAILPLETTYLSASYFANRPAIAGNGAEIVDKGVFAEYAIGSGSKPWLVEKAPERSQEASVELFTYANLQSKNVSGAFSINVPGGSSFQMSTSGDGGFIGWKNAKGNTSLLVSADQVTFTGELSVDRKISAESGLDIANGNLAFGQDSTLGFIALQNKDQIGPGNTLTFQSFTSNGIYVNAAGVTENNFLGGIRFAVNNQTLQQFYAGGVVVGGGFPDGSAILTINSLSGGIVPPKYYDYQLKKLRNVSDGTTVYSLDHHSIAWFDNGDWLYAVGQKIIQ
jgi:hypothetical protein